MYPNLNAALCFLLYLLFLKRRVKIRKQNADRTPQDRSVQTTALSTADNERLGSSAASCTHRHRFFKALIKSQLNAAYLCNVFRSRTFLEDRRNNKDIHGHRFILESLLFG